MRHWSPHSEITYTGQGLYVIGHIPFDTIQFYMKSTQRIPRVAVRSRLCQRSHDVHLLVVDVGFAVDPQVGPGRVVHEICAEGGEGVQNPVRMQVSVYMEVCV